MRSIQKQHQEISPESLCGEFPFIRYEASEISASPESELTAFSQVKPTSQHLSISPPRRFPSDVFQNLNRKEVQSVLEILHYSVAATTGNDVLHVLQLLKETVACPKVIGGVAELTSEGAFKEFNSVINVSYSSNWLYTYGKNGYAEVDPVLQSAVSSFQTQVWEQTYEGARSPKQLEFIEEARSFGLTHGITTGMVERTKNFATFFSFAGGDRKGSTRYIDLLQYLLPYLHRVLIANTCTPLSNRVKGLSPREAAVLVWMKQGKTNWEISRILGVSERTIRFHVEGIFSKLDVSSRTQAVAYAMEHGLAKEK